MRRILWPLLVLAISAMGWCQQSPEDTVRSFIAAWNDRDPQAMSKFVLGATLGKEASDPETWKTMPNADVSNLDSKIIRNFATVTLQLTMSVNGKETLSTDDTVYLRAYPQGWLIVAASPNAPLKTSISTMALMINDPTFFSRQKKMTETSNAVSNLRQVGLALIMLATDNDGILKLGADQEATRKVLMPYLKRKDPFTGPGLDGKLFSINLQLAGQKILEPSGPPSPDDPQTAKPKYLLAHPEKIVLAYEGADGKLDFPHDGKTAIVFLDGHTKLMTPDEASLVIWHS